MLYTLIFKKQIKSYNKINNLACFNGTILSIKWLLTLAWFWCKYLWSSIPNVCLSLIKHSKCLRFWIPEAKWDSWQGVLRPAHTPVSWKLVLGRCYTKMYTKNTLNQMVNVRMWWIIVNTTTHCPSFFLYAFHRVT